MPLLSFLFPVGATLVVAPGWDRLTNHALPPSMTPLQYRHSGLRAGIHSLPVRTNHVIALGRGAVSQGTPYPPSLDETLAKPVLEGPGPLVLSPVEV